MVSYNNAIFFFYLYLIRINSVIININNVCMNKSNLKFYICTLFNDVFDS